VTLAGIALSVGLSVALALADVASGAEPVLVGLSGTTISLVLDASARAERRFELLIRSGRRTTLLTQPRPASAKSRRLVK
jgi:hypothetical protein